MNSKGKILKFSDLTLEKYLLGELDEEAMARVDSAVRESSSLRDKVATMRLENLNFHHDFPISRLAEPGKVRSNARTWLPLAAAALLSGVVFMTQTRHLPSEMEWTERSKGLSTGISIYRKKGETLEKLAHGQRVKKGDLIQLSYSAERQIYGIIFSLDDRGQVTLHYPENSGDAAKLEGGREVILPSAFELDDSPKYESFFLVTAGDNFTTGQILNDLKSLIQKDSAGKHILKLPEDFTQYNVFLGKEP